jgi:hypothetical protein
MLIRVELPHLCAGVIADAGMRKVPDPPSIGRPDLGRGLSVRHLAAEGEPLHCIADAGIITRAAPILAWSLGKPTGVLAAWVLKKGGRITVIER